MQDRETDTYWAIMKGKALEGEMKGEKLKELPVGIKIQWKDWLKLHPDTLVMTLEGSEDFPKNPYLAYFKSSKGFRGVEAKDNRLTTKTAIFAFHYENKSYAVPHELFRGGFTFTLNNKQIFLYREKTASLFQSTAAHINNKGFVRVDDKWSDVESNAVFVPRINKFQKESDVLAGFDTFWYNWSLSNPETEIIKK